MELGERSLLVRVLRTVLALASAIILGAGGLAIGFVLTLVATLVLYAVGIDSAAALIVVSLVFVQGVGCLGVALAYITFRSPVTGAIGDLLGMASFARDFSVDADVPDLAGWAVVAGGYVLALASVFVGAAIATQFQVDTGTNAAVEMGIENPEILLIMIPASLLLVGPGEELLFRGVVQGRLREVFSPVTGVLVASFFFAMIHLVAISGGSPTGNLVSAALLVGPSVVLGAAYEYTGNIVVPSLIHGVYNATLFTLLYVTIVFADALPEGAAAFLAVLA